MIKDTQASSPINDTPNQNAVHVSNTQGLAQQISDELAKIKAETPEQQNLLDMAEKDIKTFQILVLHNLQECFE